MPALNITTSPNIASLNSKIVADLCAGKFYLDVAESTFIDGGEMNVLGASFKIVNPYGVTIKNYPTSGYDIFSDSPPFASVIEYSIPTQAGNFQYGTFQVTARMTDADGTEYEVTKSVKICVPDVKNKTRNYGSLSAKISGICKEGKVYIQVDTPPNYNGQQVESQENEFELLYPTESQLAPIEDIPIDSWSVQLYEGEYRLTGTICATYNFGDFVFVNVNYKVKRIKSVKCIIDECCVFGKLAEIHRELNGEKCTAADIEKASLTALDALRLLKTAQLAAECGEDASDYISDLEELLGCKCTCNCNEGTPLIPNNPAPDFSLEGCGVSFVDVGLTRAYSIENYQYFIAVNQNANVLTVGTPVLNGCIITTPLTFNISALYDRVKILALDDYSSWGAIINKSWDSIDATCLGYNPTQWAALNFVQRGQALAAGACNGGACIAVIQNDQTQASGNSVVFSWEEVSGVYAVDIYMDDVLKATVLAGIKQATIIGAADGLDHTYAIISKCSNGVIGNALDGQFLYFGCPTIAVPTVTLNNVSDADCPYDLTALVNALPSGIEAEWHNQNNTNNSSLVPDDTNAADGTYYVFAKNTDGCYSLGVKVTLVCSVATSCSAPQGMVVEAITGAFRVRFISASFPPPSYTVKRRLASDPDIDGSYTTIGTPTYNSGVARWEIADNTAVDNTLYVYKAISNCTSSSPFITYQFANISCPALTLTSDSDSVNYSFVPVGGDVTKYEVEEYNETGTTRFAVNTHLPAFSNPTTGEFIYAEPGVSYKVRIKIYIGAYLKICSFEEVTTAAGFYSSSVKYDNNLGTICSVGSATVYSDSLFGGGSTLYYDAGLTTLLTGFSYVVSPAGVIYNLNSGTGQVGSPTGATCSS